MLSLGNLFTVNMETKPVTKMLHIYMEQIYHGKPYINSLNVWSDALLRSQHMWLLTSRVQRLKYVLPSRAAELSAILSFHLQSGTDSVSKMSLSLQYNRRWAKSTNHGI